jgi:plasmid maintenance system antidote protein VapI
MTVSPSDKTAASAPAKKAPAKKAPAKKVAEKKAPAEKKAAVVSYPAPATLSGQTHPAINWSKILTAKGMSVAEVERAMEVKLGTVYRVVRHGGIPTAALTVRFAKATGTDLKALWAEVSAFTLAEAVAEVEKKAPAKKAAAPAEKKVSPARSAAKRTTVKRLTRKA